MDLVTPSRPPADASRVSQPNRQCPRLVDLVHSGATGCSSPAKIPFRHRDRQHFFPPFSSNCKKKDPHRRPPPPASCRARKKALFFDRVHRRASRAGCRSLSSVKLRVCGAADRLRGTKAWARAREDLAGRGGPARACPAARARDAQGVVVRHSDSGPVPPARVVRVRARGVALVSRARRRRPKRTRREATRRLARRGHGHRLRHRQRGRPRRTRPSPSPSRPARRRSPPRTRTCGPPRSRRLEARSRRLVIRLAVPPSLPPSRLRVSHPRSPPTPPRALVGRVRRSRLASRARSRVSRRWTQTHPERGAVMECVKVDIFSFDDAVRTTSPRRDPRVGFGGNARRRRRRTRTAARARRRPRGRSCSSS